MADLPSWAGLVILPAGELASLSEHFKVSFASKVKKISK